ncbi:hypothetical protein FPQ18DRAFT_392240 [Pyronema domesticum]|uniref:Uncharacterized protein n=1 Tax=Pyronema omphalodes (strain CBS 100304) TaxID=1076935 RepID=U4L2D9_PYROM|nr:hypothetical protein FPQ18DRAFT_392240 [Pyronema domesticum]CCX10004.1 Protein of unknown function [Pyronema omphalodes CBS 100304]
MGLEDLKDGYIFREKPLKMIPNGMIASRAEVSEGEVQMSDGIPCEEKDSRFLYMVRDQYKEFEKFTNLAESVFGMDAGHLKYLNGTKPWFLGYNDDDKAKVINKWEKEVSQKDRVYIPSSVGCFYNSDTVYYVED